MKKNKVSRREFLGLLATGLATVITAAYCVSALVSKPNSSTQRFDEPAIQKANRNKSDAQTSLWFFAL
jgi:hypothetical protein